MTDNNTHRTKHRYIQTSKQYGENTPHQTEKWEGRKDVTNLDPAVNFIDEIRISIHEYVDIADDDSSDNDLSHAHRPRHLDIKVFHI